jgi:hypothetical protein
VAALIRFAENTPRCKGCGSAFRIEREEGGAIVRLRCPNHCLVCGCCGEWVDFMERPRTEVCESCRTTLGRVPEPPRRSDVMVFGCKKNGCAICGLCFQPLYVLH